MRQFHLSDRVCVRTNYTSRTPTRLKGFVCGRLEPLSYGVQLEDDRVIWSHVDHIRLRTDTQLSTDSNEFDSIPSPTDPPVRPRPRQTSFTLFWVYQTSSWLLRSLNQEGRKCNIRHIILMYHTLKYIGSPEIVSFHLFCQCAALFCLCC